MYLYNYCIFWFNYSNKLEIALMKCAALIAMNNNNKKIKGKINEFITI